MRLLQIYPKSDFFTGAAIQLWELARELARRGHEVVIATRPSEYWAERCRAHGIRHYEVPMTSELDVRSAVRFTHILRRHEIEIVHAHKGKGRTLALIAGLFVRIPVLILNRGVSFPLDRFQRLGYTTRRVTAIIAVCDAIKRSLVNSGVPSQKVEVIYSGTDTTRFHPGVDGTAIRRELGFTGEHFVFTQIGVRSWKGNDDTIDAMVWLSAKAPHARLLIVGARNAAPLYARIRRNRLTEVVRVVGYREDIPEILAASDCCVDASYAGLGLTGTLRESLAVGTPVIGTDIEGNPELITHGKTGFLVPPRHPEALARAMLEMHSHPGVARMLAREGQRLVGAGFSTTVKADRTEALYRRLLGYPAPARPSNA
jgi:glycosyltransferase involved in cell wall biosynthesis